MQKLFFSQEKKIMNTLNISEDDLQQFICEHWKQLFPEYDLIAQEFNLKGDVHGAGKKGRIDIFAYHRDKKMFAILELKKGHGNGMSQATNYSYFVQCNFPAIHAKAKKTCRDVIPKMVEINKNIEIVIIAKTFTKEQIFRAQKSNDLFTLIKYNWFENDILVLDYVHNATDTKKTHLNPTEKHPPKWTQDVDKIWEKIQHFTTRRESNPKRKNPDPEKAKKEENFILFVKDCIDKKDAKTLHDKANLLRQGLFRDWAKLIIDLEQNTSDSN